MQTRMAVSLIIRRTRENSSRSRTTGSLRTSCRSSKTAAATVALALHADRDRQTETLYGALCRPSRIRVAWCCCSSSSISCFALWRKSIGQQQQQRIAGFLYHPSSFLALDGSASLLRLHALTCRSSSSRSSPAATSVALLYLAAHFSVCSCSIWYIYSSIYIIHNIFMIYILYAVICMWYIYDYLRDGSAAASHSTRVYIHLGVPLHY